MRSILLICILIFPLTVWAGDTGFSKKDKVLMTNIAGFSAITAWGIANWDYFDHSPSKADEKWFSKDTKEGGADKLGHLYLSYTLSHILAGTYERWGYSRKKGALLGSVSSFGIMNWMELGDSFSEYGFSYEDLVMNSIGSVVGYFLYTTPEWSEKIDLRIEYKPNFDQIDIFTDYDRLKYVMAVKLDGFDAIENKFLQYLEFHLGYYARGYTDSLDKQRNIYIGLGINLSKIFNVFSMGKMSKIANYIQVPYTYTSFEKDLN